MPKFKTPLENLEYNSKTKAGLCKNDECNNKRRDGSAYCQKCADRALYKKNAKN